MKWYEALILLIAVLAALYALGFIMNLGFVMTFKRKLYKHRKAITVLLVQKKESLLNLINTMNKNDFSLDEKYIDILDGIDINSFEKIYSNEAKKNRDSLSYVRQTLLGLANKKSTFIKNGEYILLLNLINSIDEQFRYLIAAYNADVIGYNYWINFKPYRYIFILSRTEKKDIIS
jgi:hypothetical protein